MELKIINQIRIVNNLIEIYKILITKRTIQQIKYYNKILAMLKLIKVIHLSNKQLIMILTLSNSYSNKITVVKNINLPNYP